jgi:hypothetical protein
MLAGRSIGAELDFGNPLCEAGGFVCEVSDTDGLDVTGALQVGSTTASPELVVNGSRFAVADLYRTWSLPLRELFP